jgi:hypothetical protein
MVERIDPGARREVPGANFLEWVRWGFRRGSCLRGRNVLETKKEILQRGCNARKLDAGSKVQRSFASLRMTT